MTLVNRPSRPHRPHRGFTDEWLTPPEIIKALGYFDLDPCCPEVMPWRTAVREITSVQDGLRVLWRGRVWLNPPYGPRAETFLRKMAEHGNGIALVCARTETEWFHDYVWDAATALLFLRGRLHFYDMSGKRAKGNAGGPSVLAAYGESNADVLRDSGIAGKFVTPTPRVKARAVASS
jgi:hypothetical protein